MKFRSFLLGGFITALIFLAGFFAGHLLDLGENSQLASPLGGDVEETTPLLQYTIENLAKRRYSPSTITVEEVIEETADFTSYLFSYTSGGKKITGQLNVPSEYLAATNTDTAPVIVMLRGYADEAVYSTGYGTANAAAAFARSGYVTLAPDFLGFGGSDPEPADVWEARFIKPINVIELITSLEADPTIDISLDEARTVLLNSEQLGMWGHSNGGQVALTVLEILSEPIPTTLWAPVSTPFPYSVLFYSDENEDEGREARAWVAQFERDYDARKFSLTQQLARLTGPILLHHGTADEAAPFTWSEEFADKIAVENERREQATQIDPSLIDLTYYTYPGADHNLQPAWNTVVQRDLAFFAQQFSE